MDQEKDEEDAILTQLEDLSRRMWGDTVSLATTAHGLGGLGLGLLLRPTGRNRGLAYALLGFSALAHVYALATAQPIAQPVGIAGRRVA